MKKQMKKKPAGSVGMQSVMKGVPKMKRQKVMKAATRNSVKEREAAAKRAAAGKKIRVRQKTLERIRNVKKRAKRAARNGAQYCTRNVELRRVAASARAAEVIAKAAHDLGEDAGQKAEEAKADAAVARYIADTAKQMSMETAQELTHQESENIRRIQKLERRLVEGEDKLSKTQAMVTHHQARLDTDDRQRGCVTPPPRRSTQVTQKPK